MILEIHKRLPESARELVGALGLFFPSVSLNGLPVLTQSGGTDFSFRLSLPLCQKQ